MSRRSPFERMLESLRGRLPTTASVTPGARRAGNQLQEAGARLASSGLGEMNQGPVEAARIARGVHRARPTQ
jgi:hypothetical protein